MLQPENIATHIQLNGSAIAAATCLLRPLQMASTADDIGSMWDLISEVKQS